MLRFRADENKVLFYLKGVLFGRCDNSLSGLPPGKAMRSAIATTSVMLWYCTLYKPIRTLGIWECTVLLQRHCCWHLS